MRGVTNMATMVRINDVSIISIDRSEDSWEIEGEILFEEDLSCEFAATYIPEDDEFEELSFSIDKSFIISLPEIVNSSSPISEITLTPLCLNLSTLHAIYNRPLESVIAAITWISYYP